MLNQRSTRHFTAKTTQEDLSWENRLGDED